jgi:hypothetical protein
LKLKRKTRRRGILVVLIFLEHHPIHFCELALMVLAVCNCRSDGVGNVSVDEEFGYIERAELRRAQ